MKVSQLISEEHIPEHFFSYWTTIMQYLVGEQLPEEIICPSNIQTELSSVLRAPRVGGFMWPTDGKKP
jgi:hypothetical protein